MKYNRIVGYYHKWIQQIIHKVTMVMYWRMTVNVNLDRYIILKERKKKTVNAMVNI